MTANICIRYVITFKNVLEGSEKTVKGSEQLPIENLEKIWRKFTKVFFEAPICLIRSYRNYLWKAE